MVFKAAWSEVDMAPVASRHAMRCRVPNVAIVVICLTLTFQTAEAYVVIGLSIVPYAQPELFLNLDSNAGHYSTTDTQCHLGVIHHAAYMAIPPPDTVITVSSKLYARL